MQGFALYHQKKYAGAVCLHNNNNNKHAYAGATDSFTHLGVLLVLTDRGILAHSSVVDGRSCPLLG
jgi:hypothetical protein